MKLYTKEMFLIAAEKCEISMIDAEHIMKYIDEYVTPIQLPTDEEIKKQSEYIAHNYFDMYETNHYRGLKEGAIKMGEWVINKIKGGDK